MWHLTGTRARLKAERLSADMDVQAPQRGLTVFPAGRGAIEPWQVLEVHLPQDAVDPPAGVEVYARGRDLVATYRESPSTRVRVQVYWRLIDAPQAGPAGIELIVSAQTSSLDCTPELRVSSTFARAALRELEPGLVLVRPHSEAQSYCELVYPSDYRQCSIQSGTEPARVTHRLFGEHLEKGVIRRSRIRALWLDRAEDEREAVAALGRFRQSPVPLTT